MKVRVCTYCGYVGEPTTQGMSSFFVDMLLWMVIGSIVLMSGLVPLLVIPAGWTIYHVAKYRTITCPKCENLEMVSLNSKRGKAVLNRSPGAPNTWSDTHVPSAK